MKFATLAAIVATVSAEVGYTCDGTKATAAESGWTEATHAEGTDAAKCAAEGKKVAEGDAGKLNDICLMGVATKEVAAVEDDAATADVDETAAKVDATYVCTSWSKVAGDPAADIRVAKVADDTTTYDAWGFAKGVALEDLTAAADASSAMSMTTAFAAVATLAAVAF